MFILRVATIMLIHTGLSKDLAHFQARSAFTCCGYTTRESEAIAEHPVRRRVVLALMTLGSGTVVMAISLLIPLFVGSNQSTLGLVRQVLGLGTGICVIWMISMSQWFDRLMLRIVEGALNRWSNVQVHDYHSLLQVGAGFAVGEVALAPGHWLVGRTLAAVRLGDEGIHVLGIKRANGSYIGAPTGRTYFRRDDVVLLYGLQEFIGELEIRMVGPEGDKQHEARSHHVHDLREKTLMADLRDREAIVADVQGHQE
jgi:hypothetical protein